MATAREQIEFLVTEIGMMPSVAAEIVRAAEEEGPPSENSDYDFAVIDDAALSQMLLWAMYSPTVPEAVRGMLMARVIE